PLEWRGALPASTLCRARRVAAALSGGAAEHAGPDAPRWAALAGRLAVILYRLRRFDRARQVAADVQRRTADPAEAARMAWYGAQAASRLGRYGEALATVGQALDSATLPAVWRGPPRAPDAPPPSNPP